MPQVSPSSVAPEAQKRGTPRGATPTAGGPGAAAGTLDKLKRRVPERPRLAPGVRPAGQMQESAFVDPPWLIERQGEGYVQVPRLLYRIAELADGQRTLEDIPREIRETDGVGLSADNVRHLIARQLIPNGIVPPSDGKLVVPPRSKRSVLAIARLLTIDPNALAGVTRILQVLVSPPVLVVVLAAAALIQGWMYLVHGVGSGVHDVFYTPGFILLVLLLVVVSAGFHELGHAAALRYAGGTPRSFGFGMYFMYPVFFTDVSDNYRLRRWPRVRTDLGGFYFNLVFALGIFGLYVLTRSEALLLIIVLMNFDIIRQLLPFVRLDGYWTLADLTGIPDFFSTMGAFLRSILPVGQKGRSLPELKWWGKAVFLGYVVVTIPALALLSFLMLRSVPRVLATGWDAVGKEAGAFQQAEVGGQILGMAGAVGQSVLILLPVAGLLYSLYRLGRWAVSFLLEWSAASPQRRAIAGVLGVGFVGLLYAMWVPQIPFNPLYQPDAFQPIGADERLTVGDALLGMVVQRSADTDLPDWLPALRPVVARTGVSGSGQAQSGSSSSTPSPGSGGAPGVGGAASSVGGAAGSSVGGGAAGSSASGGSGSAGTANAAGDGGASSANGGGAAASGDSGSAGAANSAGAGSAQGPAGGADGSAPGVGAGGPAASPVDTAATAVDAVASDAPAVNAPGSAQSVVRGAAAPNAQSVPGAAVSRIAPAAATVVSTANNVPVTGQVATAVPGIVPSSGQAVNSGAVNRGAAQPAVATVHSVTHSAPSTGGAVAPVAATSAAVAATPAAVVATAIATAETPAPVVATTVATVETPAAVVGTAVPTIGTPAASAGAPAAVAGTPVSVADPPAISGTPAAIAATVAATP